MKRLGLAFVLGLISCGCAADQSSLSPDVNLRVACPQLPSDTEMRSVERKMFDDGFDVLDIVALAKQRHADYPFRVKVEALDKGGRYISLSALDLTGAAAPPKGSPLIIHVSLYTRPPTQRDASLEAAMTSWATEGLGCAVRDTDRNVNDPEAVAIYERTVDDVRSRFKEAREMKAAPNVLLLRSP